MLLEESSTYRAILEKGEAKGRQQDVIDVLQERFGVVPEVLEDEIRACRDSARLQAAIRSAVRITALDEFHL